MSIDYDIAALRKLAEENQRIQTLIDDNHRLRDRVNELELQVRSLKFSILERRVESGRPVGWRDGMRNESEILEYARFRFDVMERDGHKCQDCGKSAEIVHHIMMWKYHPNLRYERSNGVSLCGDCHNARHSTNRGKYPNQPV